MKIMFSCIHFAVWPYPPKNNERKKKEVFYTGKLYGLTGMQYNLHSTTRLQYPHKHSHAHDNQTAVHT